MTPRPLVSLVCIVGGPVFEGYWQQLEADAERFWFPHYRRQIIRLDALQGWPQASSQRRQVLLDNLDQVSGEYVFMIDADMRIEQPVGVEILADGITVTTHPGFPPGTTPDLCPYERDRASHAFVPLSTEEPDPLRHGSQYFPGAFHGGRRADLVELCETTSAWTADDLARGVEPVWYDESYLNRYLIDRPPALILDRRFCYWDHWGPSPSERIIVHLDKTADEFDATRKPAGVS